MRTLKFILWLEIQTLVGRPKASFRAAWPLMNTLSDGMSHLTIISLDHRRLQHQLLPSELVLRNPECGSQRIHICLGLVIRDGLLLLDFHQ